MMGTTKLEPRRKLYAGLLPLLLVGGLAMNCSSKSDNSTPLNIAGATASGGAPSAGASGASAGASTAGASGAATGNQPGPTGCASGSSKHTDDGLCYCQPTSLTYCPDACADLTVDPDHCGGCTTKCADTQGCSASKCSGTASALVPAVAGCGAVHMVLSGTTLYWTETMRGTVNSVPAAGGTPKQIAMGEMAPSTLAVSGTNVYWLATGAKAIRKKASDGTGMASDVVASSVVTTACTGVTGDCGIGGFTVTAAGDVYYAIATKIFKLPAAGGTATIVGHEDSGIPRALAVENDLVGYPADVNGDVDVIKEVAGTDAYCKTEVNADNTNCVRVARSQGSLILDNVYLLNKVVYWVDSSSVKSNDATDNQAGNVTVANADSNLAAFAINGTTVFFADKSESAQIWKSGTAAGAVPQLLARKQVGVTSIAGDATHAYWANGDCSIMSLGL